MNREEKKRTTKKAGNKIIGTSGPGVNVHGNNSGKIVGASGPGVNIGPYKKSSILDLQLNIDMTSIAYVIGCFLHTKRKINDQEFNHFIMNLKKLNHSNNKDLSLLSNTSLNNNKSIF